jgi:hypothetical protein
MEPIIKVILKMIKWKGKEHYSMGQIGQLIKVLGFLINFMDMEYFTTKVLLN